jgi:GMP synthase PP-ATPase subunit
MLGHRAFGARLRTIFVENGLMRQGESEQVVNIFHELGVPVEVIDARDEFFAALKGIVQTRRKNAKRSPRPSIAACTDVSSGPMAPSACCRARS